MSSATTLFPLLSHLHQQQHQQQCSPHSQFNLMIGNNNNLTHNTPHQYEDDNDNNNNNNNVAGLKYYTYGLILPMICGIGIIGNLFNLIVLNQPNMKGTAYIYMRGYSSAALTAIIVAIPFAIRSLADNDSGYWANYYQAFFHTYLELYFGNSCLGIGVMMLVALTMERFVAVCHPEKSRILKGSKKAHAIIALIPICTLLVYLPHLFRAKLVECLTITGGVMYQKIDQTEYLSSMPYTIYVWCIGFTFRLGPTVLLAYLNLRIIISYRRTCENRRRMTGRVSGDDRKKFAEESRIMLLLGSTSILFFICVTPMVVLQWSMVMISNNIRNSFPFQIFRAIANLLEVTNYSLTFYIYCLFSREFRRTFLALFHKEIKTTKTNQRRKETATKQLVERDKNCERPREDTPMEGLLSDGASPPTL